MGQILLGQAFFRPKSAQVLSKYLPQYDKRKASALRSISPRNILHIVSGQEFRALRTNNACGVAPSVAVFAGCLAALLSSCAAYENSVFSNFPQDTVFERPDNRQERLAAVDDAKCQKLRFKSKTEAYGNCRLRLEQIRATNQAASASQEAAAAARVRRPSTSEGGASLLCKHAISRNDEGGIRVHC
jgi:hypothetical protein